MDVAQGALVREAGPRVSDSRNLARGAPVSKHSTCLMYISFCSFCSNFSSFFVFIFLFQHIHLDTKKKILVGVTLEP